MFIAGVKFSYKYEWVLDRRSNGLDYVKVTSNSLPFTVERMHIHLENLFNGDKLLGKLYAYNYSSFANLLNALQFLNFTVNLLI